jgi:hypothetical protein
VCAQGGRNGPKSLGGGAASTATQKASDAQLGMLTQELLRFEATLPWECVYKRFASQRNKWRSRVGHAATLKQYADTLLHLLSVRVPCRLFKSWSVHILFVQRLRIPQSLQCQLNMTANLDRQAPTLCCPSY